MSDRIPNLRRAEIFMLTVAASVGLLDVVILMVRDVAIDVAGYGRICFASAGMLLIGMFYRKTQRSERIAASTICAGAFIFFMMSLSLFNYLLLPVWGFQIDEHLIRLDGHFGYHWPDAVAFSSRFPALNEAMRWAYLSTLPQFTLLVLLLGFTARFDDLYEMIAMVTLSACATVAFWAVFPSIGPSAFFDLPKDVLSAAAPVVGPAYGQALKQLLAEGAPFLAPNEARGLVALPSYHTVLAFAAVYYCRNVKPLLPVYIVLNAAILPAVLVHGGHHLVDIAGGVLVFAASAALARRLGSRRPEVQATDAAARPAVAG